MANNGFGPNDILNKQLNKIKKEEVKKDEIKKDEVEVKINEKVIEPAIVKESEKEPVKVEQSKETKEPEETNNELLDRLKRMEEMQKQREEEQKKRTEHKPITIYISPENYKEFHKMKGKGEKSKFINDLMDMWYGHGSTSK